MHARPKRISGSFSYGAKEKVQTRGRGADEKIVVAHYCAAAVSLDPKTFRPRQKQRKHIGLSSTFSFLSSLIPH
jgi:hypothetical protein